MPIAIYCPGCNARLQAPDSAVGKTVKCPKCQAAMIIPASEPEFETVDDDNPTSTRKSDKGPRTPATDEDVEPPRRKRRTETDFDEDEAPRRRRREADDDDDETPRRRRPRDEEEDEDDEEARPTRQSMPGIVKAAGIIWIVYGTIGTLNTAISLVLAAGQNANGQNGPGANPGSPFCGLAIAFAFAYCGFQTVTGKAKDTLGNSIGSLLLGGLQLLVGIVLIVLSGGGIGDKLQIDKDMAGIIGALVCLMGIMLVSAGVMGLIGRQGYKDWYKSNRGSGRRRSRRRRDDDD
jgi:DNA-directed RNA polymerase subunit M/transcription elongation factor TFIIS